VYYGGSAIFTSAVLATPQGDGAPRLMVRVWRVDPVVHGLNQFQQMIFVGKVSEVALMSPEEPNSAYRA